MHEKNKAIVDKYNRFSQMFMAGKGGEKIEKSGNERMSRTVSGMTELNKEPEPAYLPLHLDLGIKDPGSTDIKEEEEGSAFAKSVFAVKKSNRVDTLHGTNGSASGGSGSGNGSGSFNGDDPERERERDKEKDIQRNTSKEEKWEREKINNKS